MRSAVFFLAKVSNYKIQRVNNKKLHGDYCTINPELFNGIQAVGHLAGSFSDLPIL